MAGFLEALGIKKPKPEVGEVKVYGYEVIAPINVCSALKERERLQPDFIPSWESYRKDSIFYASDGEKPRSYVVNYIDHAKKIIVLRDW